MESTNAEDIQSGRASILPEKKKESEWIVVRGKTLWITLVLLYSGSSCACATTHSLSLFEVITADESKNFTYFHGSSNIKHGFYRPFYRRVWFEPIYSRAPDAEIQTLPRDCRIRYLFHLFRLTVAKGFTRGHGAAYEVRPRKGGELDNSWEVVREKMDLEFTFRHTVQVRKSRGRVFQTAKIWCIGEVRDDSKTTREIREKDLAQWTETRFNQSCTVLNVADLNLSRSSYPFESESPVS